MRGIAGRAALRAAAQQIDASHDREEARRTALVTRHVVHDACTVALEAAATAGGARPICLDPVQSRRSSDLYAYLASTTVGGMPPSSAGCSPRRP